MSKFPRGPALLSVALATTLFMQTADATDLLDVWRAAAQNDKTYAVDSAAHAVAQPRRDQAAALWKPRVGLTASVEVAASETDTQGAQISAPGLGQSSDLEFSTSVTRGAFGRWAVASREAEPVRGGDHSRIPGVPSIPLRPRKDAAYARLYLGVTQC